MTPRSKKALAVTLGSSIAIAGAMVASPSAVAQENQPPVITANDATVPLNGDYGISLLNIDAQDPEDGNVITSVTTSGSVDTSVPGEYPVTITASDANGLKTSKTVTVTVLGASEPAPKNTVPVISAKDVTLNVGEKFEIALINPSATDTEDGNVTDSIEVLENNVDTSKPGTYYVTLAAYDSWGFQAKKIVEVTVVDPDASKPVDPKDPDKKDEDSKDGDKKDEDSEEKSEAAKSEAAKKSEEAKKSEAAQAHNNKRSLANTGASVLGIIVLGAALVGGGVFLMRRRRG
ncbi:immunoglobulin-like domain-containing protein [Corynebacterium gerontici]|uniref:Pesticidal crystal protein cry22Aa n=1 Tax=Corynebacterium gerontici TaxID=2079234 RepID=A0A3G6J1R8_9CORY|nr:immunoglobulin-like domain-containing protein [Corynebacterium gerontici]AZA11826.1 Pesticidal crystal protein cry22Aa [Corynebacterium gerontici]